MSKIKPATVESITAEWVAKIATINSVLGRLELVSSLRDPHTGRYIHHGMSQSIGNRTHDVLLNSHKEVFAEWQAMNLREQMRDLRVFLASLPKPPYVFGPRKKRRERSNTVLETWTELEPYRNFIPLSLPALERDLFLTNLRSIISVLKAQIAKQLNLPSEANHNQ
jgi:hypothetical protein